MIITAILKKVYYAEQVSDTVMLKNKTAYKLKTTYKGLHKIFQTWTNLTATLKWAQK